MSNTNPLLQARALGQSIWYDYIRSDLMSSGQLAELIAQHGLAGLTSNPAIFDKAISDSSLYDERIRKQQQREPDISTADLFYQLAIEDLQAAADIFAPTYAKTNGRDGYVSLEVSPDLAHDAKATIHQALELHARVKRPNLMIKVPATLAGIEAIEQLTAEGVSVNVTLLFSLERYQAVLSAYMRGLESRLAAGKNISNIASVASFFISRVDSAVDALLKDRLQQGQSVSHLLGQIAIANAQLAYAHYQDTCSGADWQKLAAAGAQTQRLLWASTGTKDPEYRDVVYVEALIGENTVNTLPPATYEAFLDHGVASTQLPAPAHEAAPRLSALSDLGIDLTSITDRLEREGVQAFVDAFDHLLQTVDSKRRQLQAS